MPTNPERRRHRRIKSFPGQQDLTIIYQTAAGPAVMEAKLLDFTDAGLSVELAGQMSTGSSAEIIGEIQGAAGSQPLRRRGSVRRCSATENGKFVVGLSFEPITEGSSPGEAAKDGELTDYYEVLQLSRNANSDTIQRVFRLLAKRYHPDNTEAGNPELFREIVEAARVLMDPKLRAAYDARLDGQTQGRFKIFETWQTSRGVEAEKRKRNGILALLYGRRLTEPQQPSLSLRDLEAMLDCPREHLEFTIWFLKESKWIKSSDNARYEITLQGVIMAEQQEETYPRRPAAPQLPAAKEENEP
jgi:hypothetical protein